MQRTYIGQRLLLALLKEPNAQVFFAHKVLACNLRRKTVTFEDLKWQPQDGKPSKVDNGPAVAEDKASRRNTVTYNFMIGADGAHSAVRQQLMRESNIDYEQSYVDALWCDFVIAPDREGHHKLDPAYLHVWPDKERVFIVQPDVVSWRPNLRRFGTHYGLGRFFSRRNGCPRRRICPTQGTP